MKFDKADKGDRTRVSVDTPNQITGDPKQRWVTYGLYILIPAAVVGLLVYAVSFGWAYYTTAKLLGN